MNKLAIALLTLPLLAGAAQAATPKMPAAVRADLKQAVKAAPFYQGTVKPSYQGAVTKDGKAWVATLTLRGLGSMGPVHVEPRPLYRIGVGTAFVKFSPTTGKENGKIRTSVMVRPL